MYLPEKVRFYRMQWFDVAGSLYHEIVQIRKSVFLVLNLKTVLYMYQRTRKNYILMFRS